MLRVVLKNTTSLFISLLRKSSIFLFLFSIFIILNPKLRSLRSKENADLYKVTEKIQDLLTINLSDNKFPLKKMLIIGMPLVRYISQESLIRKSFELAGYGCYVLIPRNPIVKNAYSKLGSDQILFEDDFVVKFPEKFELDKTRISSIEKLLELNFHGVRVGKYAVSTLLRQRRQGKLDFQDEGETSQVSLMVDESVKATQWAMRVLKEVSPDVVVLADRSYSPAGELFDLCMERSISVITWNVAHRNNTLMLKRYNASNSNDHPSSLSDVTWKKCKGLKWTPLIKATVLAELRSCYSSGEWYGEVGTQINKNALHKNELSGLLGFKNKKKVVGLFPHIFWDATFAWGTDLFSTYEEWFISSVKAACRNTDVNWVIKVHPANVTKDYREGVEKEHSEITAIAKNIGELPPHVKLLDAHSPISTLSLLETIDICITVRGTVGLEAACLGKNVITAGTGRYDRHGFTIDPKSKSEYLQLLENLDNLGNPTVEMNQLALKFAYGILLKRPLKTKIYDMSFQKELGAELSIDFNCKSLAELKESSDLRSLADWIVSQEEDYLDGDDHLPQSTPKK